MVDGGMGGGKSGLLDQPSKKKVRAPSICVASRNSRGPHFLCFLSCSKLNGVLPGLIQNTAGRRPCSDGTALLCYNCCYSTFARIFGASLSCMIPCSARLVGDGVLRGGRGGVRCACGGACFGPHPSTPSAKHARREPGKSAVRSRHPGRLADWEPCPSRLMPSTPAVRVLFITQEAEQSCCVSLLLARDTPTIVPLPHRSHSAASVPTSSAPLPRSRVSVALSL